MQRLFLKINFLCIILAPLSNNVRGTDTDKVSGEVGDPLQSIRAFERVDDHLASSGFVLDDQFEMIRNDGFTHMISLLPGDPSHEEELVTSLGMTFTNIKVDWGNPTMKNLEAFIGDMKEHSGEKVYVHCQANMRASAFVFLYRVTRLGVDKKQAKALLDSIWYPTGTWHHFIEDGLLKYDMDPEYRFEPDFIKLVREKGTDEAYREYSERQNWQKDRIIQEQGSAVRNTPVNGSAKDPVFREPDLRRLGDEYIRDGEPEKAVDVFELNVKIFPDSWEAHNRLAETYLDQGREGKARESYSRVLVCKPEDIRAKRMLGKLGVQEYLVYREGVGVDLQKAEKLSGIYDMGDSRVEFFTKNGKFYFKPSWSREPFELFADSDSRYFVRERNWIFDFSDTANFEVKFITSGGNYKGKKF